MLVVDVVMVPEYVPLQVPVPLLKVIKVLLDGLDALPLTSSDATTTVKAVPAVPVPGTVVKTSFEAAPAENVIPLVMAVKLCPPDAVAVIVIVPTPE